MSPALIAMLIQYGPLVLKLLTTAKPAIDALIASGVHPDKAHAAVLGGAADHIAATDWVAQQEAWRAEQNAQAEKNSSQ